MSQLIFQGELKHNNDKINIVLQILLFEEDGIHIAYSPALDVSACGNTEEEAKEEFGSVLSDHLTYCLNKKTIFEDLRAHGWTIKSKKRIKSPTDEKLLQLNDTYRDIKENKQYKTIEREIIIPAV
jgi:hypothetical protein